VASHFNLALSVANDSVDPVTRQTLIFAVDTQTANSPASATRKVSAELESTKYSQQVAQNDVRS